MNLPFNRLGCCYDGHKTGVGIQLKSKYAPLVLKFIVWLRVNLAWPDAIKKNEFLLEFRDKFNSLYKFISASRVRTLALRNIKNQLDEPEISVKLPYSIRWLGLRDALGEVFSSYISV